MATLRLTKNEIQELLVWGTKYNDMIKEIGMKFREDEIKLYTKLFLLSRINETKEMSILELHSRFPEWKVDSNAP